MRPRLCERLRPSLAPCGNQDTGGAWTSDQRPDVHARQGAFSMRAGIDLIALSPGAGGRTRPRGAHSVGTCTRGPAGGPCRAPAAGGSRTPWGVAPQNPQIPVRLEAAAVRHPHLSGVGASRLCAWGRGDAFCFHPGEGWLPESTRAALSLPLPLEDRQPDHPFDIELCLLYAHCHGMSLLLFFGVFSRSGLCNPGRDIYAILLGRI